MASRIIWKGAISFGLVHVPVALYPASTETGVDFDWLDKRSMDPVGYKRINKRTGKLVEKDDIVKGVKLDDGDYVVLSEDEIKAAYPQSTQTIEIEAFVQAAEVGFMLLERPYYLEPIGKGEHVYVLLREAMRQAGVIGIARLVMHSKEHLAALVATDRGLMVNTLRWASEIRAADDLSLPAGGGSSKLKPNEMKMARQLIAEMTTEWKPAEYADSFSDAIHALVRKKAAAGKTEQVTPVESAPDTAAPSNVVDLTELLAKSLAGRRPAAGAAGKRASAKTAAKASSKTPAPVKRAARAARH